MITPQQLKAFDAAWPVLWEKLNDVLADNLIMASYGFVGVTNVGEMRIREAIITAFSRLVD